MFDPANDIQSGTVITRSNITLYYIPHWVIETDYGSGPTKDTTYLALTGKLCDVFRGDFGKNWPHYNGTAMYVYFWSPKSRWHNGVPYNPSELHQFRDQATIQWSYLQISPHCCITVGHTSKSTRLTTMCQYFVTNLRHQISFKYASQYFKCTISIVSIFTTHAWLIFHAIGLVTQQNIHWNVKT